MSAIFEQRAMGIVSMESPTAETILFQLQLSNMGNSLLESLIRFSVMDVVCLKNLQARVALDHPRPNGLVIVTETAYDALLIAREVVMFRYIQPLHVSNSSLSFSTGVHCSGSLREDGFSTSHPDVQLARSCAEMVKANEIGCTSDCFQAANKDARSDPSILSEYSALALQPASHAWKFEERFLSRRQNLSHSYFVSYSHKDMPAADHLEVLLRRQGRRVRRDEGFLDSETMVSEQLAEEIRRCDTFIALYSSRYEISDYCRGELAVAQRSKIKNQKPSRIVLLLLEETVEVPVDYASYLSRLGDSRVARESLVLQLVAQEGT